MLFQLSENEMKFLQVLLLIAGMYQTCLSGNPISKWAFSCTNQNVRELPDINSNIVGKLRRLEEVTILDMEGNQDFVEGNQDYWYKIRFKDKFKKNQVGYVFGHNISLRKKGQITRVLRLTDCSVGDFQHVTFEDLTPSWAMNNWGKYEFTDFCEYREVDGEYDLYMTKKFANKRFRITYNILPADCVIDGDGSTEPCETETIVHIELVK
ncbi:MAG: SH3 domain-containing protein [Bacteroidetes bacterium]|nr:SH3 domain-containing protein [Bacteroidota bacterium]